MASSPGVAGYPGSRRSSKSIGSVASSGEKGRLSKLKTCVCAASAQLGREKSRLLKLEQKYVQRANRVLEREEVVDDLDSEAMRKEEELVERREHFMLQELHVSQELEALQQSTREAQQLQAVLAERHHEVLRQERQQMRQQLRLSKRMERVDDTSRHICEERQRWQDRGEAVEQTELRLLEAETEALRGKLPLRCEALEEARRNGEELREEVASWQAKLEPIRRELQMKEADLDERCTSVARRKEELELREQRLAQRRVELEEAAERAPLAARQRKAELQNQLEELCEEVDQRQQMLQDIRCKKTERISTLRDDLAAAELSESAWRERCTSLETRKKQLLEQIQLEESQVQEKESGQ
ncbi:unnamed protein product [Cladocopium goreaui]|uniref:Uncharacterized protein n=1 Tax=Cladocopium goreaui TaxID=2562237 RepID=A0A9P1CGG4_9DINO|nr:unnamed protein product [Cladocopium goreaui]